MSEPAMSSGIVGLVLCGALLHASWNAMVKSRTDTFLVTAMVAGSAGIWSALVLLFAAAPDPASWPFIAISTVVQVSYYALLIAAYRGADMSHAYPLMRGTAPLLVAIVSAPLLHEALRPMQWLAVACICGGILALYLNHRSTLAGPANLRSTAFALATACMIATFTLIDGVGVRLSHAPLAYTCWVFMLTGFALLAWAAKSRPGQLWSYLRANRTVAMAGGAANLGSYSIALFAMTRAPVAAVAALRETSILFAVAIAALVLREKVGAVRLAAVLLVGCGAVAMRLA